MTDLNALAAKVEGLTHSDNYLDVAVEIALFKPGSCFLGVRANNAGTKVIYTDKTGNNVTCWAEDWTAENRRPLTAAALRARAGEGGA